MIDEGRMIVLNDLFNHFIAFLLFPDIRDLPNFFEILVNGFVYASNILGSWICVLICTLIALISRFRFQKVFVRPVWKYAFTFIVGGYVLLFAILFGPLIVEVFTCNSGHVFIGEEGIGYAAVQILMGMPLTLFTIAYLISFICRLIKSGRNKSKKEKGDESCQ